MGLLDPKPPLNSHQLNNKNGVENKCTGAKILAKRAENLLIWSITKNDSVFPLFSALVHLTFISNFLLFPCDTCGCYESNKPIF